MIEYRKSYVGFCARHDFYRKNRDEKAYMEKYCDLGRMSASDCFAFYVGFVQRLALGRVPDFVPIFSKYSV